jgi:hypothetical protein
VKILAVDTALGACSVAVLNNNEVLAHCFSVMTRGHAEALAPMVETAMRDASLNFSTGWRSPPGRVPSPANASALPLCVRCVSRSIFRSSD